MPSYAKTILVGHLTRDPELKYTPKGTAVGNIAIACNYSWKNESGEKKEEVSFFDAIAWGKTAETIAQYVRKGAPILLECRPKQETWDDKQTGQKRHRVVFIVESFTFLGGKSEAGESDTKPATTSKSVVPAKQLARQKAEDQTETDDIPF